MEKNMNFTLTKRQLENAKDYLREVICSNKVGSENRLRAEYYLKVLNEDSCFLYVADILAMFIGCNREYAINNIMNSKKKYNIIEIRTKDLSKTKRRVCIKTIECERTSRSELIQLAKQYIQDNNITLNDVAFILY